MGQEQIQIQLNLEDLKKMKIFIGTPMYGGVCHGIYVKSLLETTSLLTAYGIKSEHWFVGNESLITRARNHCAFDFLKSDSTHLLFIDADISWKASDVLYMFNLLTQRADIKILAGLYPRKGIAWQQVLQAAKTGSFDDASHELRRIAGSFAFNVDPDMPRPDKIPVYEPVKVSEAGTGFMLIERSVFAKYAEAYPEQCYISVEGERIGANKHVYAFFDCQIDPKTKSYLSEDYMFCQNCNKMGVHTWALPFVELHHAGSYVYEGSIGRMAAYGINPVHDP
ncbi:MAG TPA: hypothetical protein ACN46R_07695 [Prochlorococcus sp.]